MQEDTSNSERLQSCSLLRERTSSDRCSDVKDHDSEGSGEIQDSVDPDLDSPIRYGSVKNMTQLWEHRTTRNTSVGHSASLRVKTGNNLTNLTRQRSLVDLTTRNKTTPQNPRSNIGRQTEAKALSRNNPPPQALEKTKQLFQNEAKSREKQRALKNQASSPLVRHDSLPDLNLLSKNEHQGSDSGYVLELQYEITYLFRNGQCDDALEKVDKLLKNEPKLKEKEPKIYEEMLRIKVHALKKIHCWKPALNTVDELIQFSRRLNGRNDRSTLSFMFLKAEILMLCEDKTAISLLEKIIKKQKKYLGPSDVDVAYSNKALKDAEEKFNGNQKESKKGWIRSLLNW